MTAASSLFCIAFVSYALCMGLSTALPMQLAGTKPTARKIALLHMYDAVPFFQRLGSLTEANKRRYADRHGYDFVLSTPRNTSGIYKKVDCYADTQLIQVGPDAAGDCWATDSSFDIDHSRAPTFGKIKLALAACQGRGEAWLLWSDADAMVVNQSTPLESIIDDAYDIMLTYDWLMLNAGVLLFKCSDWTKGFLNSVYNARQFDDARALDQSSFQEHIDNLTDIERDEHVKVIPKHAMNVYLEEYRPGDFVVHMAGKLYEATESGLFAIANQLDILSMVDDIEDVKAFFRNPGFLNFYSGVCPVKYGERQSSCKPGEARRLFLNESLGSMSYPNRYRHVGLRYYWLGDWKDKYDVEGWNVKKKALATISGAGRGSETTVKTTETGAQQVPLVRDDVKLLLHEELGVNDDDDDEGGDEGAGTTGDDSGGVEGVKGQGGKVGGNKVLWYGLLAGVGVGAAAIGGLRIWNRKKMWSKIQ